MMYHLAPSLQVAEAIASAVERGLTIPIIYNTSSYDALSSLALMDGLVDIVSHSRVCRVVPQGVAGVDIVSHSRVRRGVPRGVAD